MMGALPSIIAVKVWVEGSTDLPPFKKLFHELGEDQIAETLDVVGGWPTLLSRPRERWIDGCREAIIIMDGDRGRHLKRRDKPPTSETTRATDRLKGLPIRLYVLERYGIENYFPQAALETVLGRSLADYMPIPVEMPIGQHLVERNSRFNRILELLHRFMRIRFSSRRASFYNKSLNEQVAKHITVADIGGTDLMRIIEAVKTRNSELQLM